MKIQLTFISKLILSLLLVTICTSRINAQNSTDIYFKVEKNVITKEDHDGKKFPESIPTDKNLTIIVAPKSDKIIIKYLNNTNILTEAERITPSNFKISKEVLGTLGDTLNIEFFEGNKSIGEKQIIKLDIADSPVETRIVKKKDFLVFPFKDYNPTLKFKNKKHNRIFVIDAKADKYLNGDETGLYHFKDTILEEAKALPINQYLAVVIKNYNFQDLENFIITIDGENYSYEHDIREIYENTTKKKDSVTTTQSSKGNDKTTELNSKLTEYRRILRTYTFMNLNDLNKLQKFKLSLEEYYENNKDDFDQKSIELLNDILSWSPQNVSLTPISINVPDNDEVDINYTLKEKETNAETKSLGSFKTFGGITVDYGAAFYLTNLKNNNVYTKTESIDGVEELRAKMDSNNQRSIGLGLNIDVSYRTGAAIRPTFNFGFFVPLEEEITPFIATGPGVGFYGKNYKINFSYGLSIGKINSIKDEYKDVNLTNKTLTNEEITEKILDTGYYYALSISFNILNSNNKKN